MLDKTRKNDLCLGFRRAALVRNPFQKLRRQFTVLRKKARFYAGFFRTVAHGLWSSFLRLVSLYIPLS